MPRVESALVPVMCHLGRHAAERPEAPALHVRDHDEWQSISWDEYHRRVDDLAAALVDLGVEPGDRVAVLSDNRPEWHIADLAILSLGAVTVPCYPTSSSSQLAFLLTHSGSSIAFVADSAQLAKVLLQLPQLPALRSIVMFDETDGLDTESSIVTLAELSETGAALRRTHPDTVQDRRDAVSLDDLATIVYTSGTTGQPKGAMLTHRNIAETIQRVREVVPTSVNDRYLSFLPVSHIAERMVSHLGHVACGGQTWFAQSLAEVAVDLTTCRPTVFLAVPRVWEKFREAILAEIAAKPAPVRAAFRRLLELGSRASTGELPPFDRVQHRALDATVGRTLRHGLGLDRARILISTAAPIHPDLLRWFASLGMPISEVWGQTEDCGPATINPPDAIRFGTVGTALPGLELRVADDGEVLVRSDTVCAGYWDDPEATAALIDPEGWMHTGDLGELDAEGSLRIVGRKKDVIVTSSGKNISPAAIESRLELEMLIAKAIVVGDSRPYLTALLTLDIEVVAEWASQQAEDLSIEALGVDPHLHREIDRAVGRVNAAHSRIEGIKAWRLLPYEFTIVGGELTPTLKVKRQVVVERHHDLIVEMYDSSSFDH